MEGERNKSSQIPCDVYNVEFFNPIIMSKGEKKESERQNPSLLKIYDLCKEHHLWGTYRDQSSGSDGLIKASLCAQTSMGSIRLHIASVIACLWPIIGCVY